MNFPSWTGNEMLSVVRVAMCSLTYKRVTQYMHSLNMPTNGILQPAGVGGPFPSGRSRPIARQRWPRDGAALARSRRLRPSGLRSLPRVSVAVAQPDPPPSGILEGGRPS
jgi:hypothetical protein